jgi:hypothetical protein
MPLKATMQVKNYTAQGKDLKEKKYKRATVENKGSFPVKRSVASVAKVVGRIKF